MSRIINEPITVHQRPDFIVDAFIWRRRLYKVLNVLSWWREPSQWWNGESEKILIRVTAANRSAGIYELCRTDDKWFLRNLID